MAWKPTGAPAVRKQRRRWVVRIDGFDTETGRKRPRQLGTYDNRRAAQAAAVQSPDNGPRRRIGERWPGRSRHIRTCRYA